MKVLSLFSGVGGFDMGLENAGMETVFQCEWDKHANSILHRHWPDVPKWDDVSTLTGKHILANAPEVDVVAWGSPCQDLSVAGKRAGLEGGRSGLFHEGIRIIKELQEETNGQYPRISIWENVVGALNSNGGADFGIILDEMAQAGALVIEWAVLDAQYFGVPQRRRRVFVIAIFDPVLAERSPSPLLPVAESLPGHLAKSKPKRQSPTNKTSESIGASSSDNQLTDEQSYAESSFAQFKEGDVAALKASGGVLGGGSETLIVGALTVSDLTKQVTNEIVSKNLLQVVEPFVKSSRAQTSEDSETWIPGEVNPTLNSFDVGDTRATTAIVQEPIFFQAHMSGEARVKEKVMHSLSAMMGTGGNNVPMLAFDTQFGSNANVTEDVAPTLKASQQSPSVAYDAEPTMAVRRLTPLECERLMGWPDDHTRYKADGTEQADTHRYKQCGNGVASPVAQWIAKHLLNI
jgi:DNA (cytosine-5)-methyltransferase 1